MGMAELWPAQLRVRIQRCTLIFYFVLTVLHSIYCVLTVFKLERSYKFFVVECWKMKMSWALSRPNAVGCHQEESIS